LDTLSLHDALPISLNGVYTRQAIVCSLLGIK
jgi:hypothetical protein